RGRGRRRVQGGRCRGVDRLAAREDLGGRVRRRHRTRRRRTPPGGGIHRPRRRRSDRRRPARRARLTAPGGSPASETPGDLRASETPGDSRASETPGGAHASDVSGRRILGLALPALGVLAAEPLYLLFDIAVVGRLGALPLAGLAIGGLILAQVSTQLTFLSYGTTSRAARLHGADRHDDAVGEGVQATWLAMIVGLTILLVGQALAGPVARLLAGDAEIADAAVSWLRVALFGAPLILVGLAGNGWMRGVQDTIRPLRFVIAGLALSAVLCPVLVHGLLGAPRWELVGS